MWSTASELGLRSVHTQGLVPKSSPCSESPGQVSSRELPVFVKKSTKRDQIWSPWLVPGIHTGLNSWDKSLRHEATFFLKTLLLNCSWDNQSQIHMISSHNSLRAQFRDGAWSLGSGWGHWCWRSRLVCYHLENFDRILRKQNLQLCYLEIKYKKHWVI